MSTEYSTRLIVQYAALARSEYCRARNQWHLDHEGRETDWGSRPVPRYDGGTDSSGRRFRGVWEGIARFAIANRVDPVRFIRAQFAVRMSKPVEPTGVATAGSLASYHLQRQRDVEATGRLFRAQQERALIEINMLKPCRDRGWTDCQINRAVLGNPSIPLSALFRYCVAKKDGHDDIAASYLAAALRQYLAQPEEYERVWAGWLPPEIRAAADDLLVAAAAAPRPVAAD